MRENRKYIVAVALLAVIALVFGVVGTVAPPLAKETTPISPQQESSPDSVGHFQNPPTYDSGWVDIRSKAGQYFTLKHNLNTTEVVVDITGKQSLDPIGGAFMWSKTYGGTSGDYTTSMVQTADGGYAVAGQTASYGAGGYDFWLVKTDSAGNMQWNKTYGGTGTDYATSVVQTADGGYVLAGETQSYGAGASDFWLVKTNSAGNMLWNRTYGGASSEYWPHMVQTSDGGYALAGGTQSYGAGGWDFWLVKTNSTGNMQWSKTYGGWSTEYAISVVQTSDGGYALAGLTYTYAANNADAWLVKTDASGTMQWSKTYTGADYEGANSVVQTSDGGYTLACFTTYPSNYDFWLIKTDSTGNALWNKKYGGAQWDIPHSMVQTADGGYVLAGETQSYGAGSQDFWLVKTDAAGNALWNRTYGGTGSDYAYSVVQTSDGGYALAGFTNSYGAGDYDFWLIKTSGVLEFEHQKLYGGTSLPGWHGADLPGWSQTYGGASEDAAYCLVLDGTDFVMAGYTTSYGAGAKDAWLVNIRSSKTVAWSKTRGGTGDDVARSVVRHPGSQGFIMAGYTTSYGAGAADFWLVRTDSGGNMQWNKTYGGTGDDRACSVVYGTTPGPTTWAVAGYTGSGGAGGYDFWLVKADDYGNMQWNKTYGGTGQDMAYFLIRTSDGGYALAGSTNSYGAGGLDSWLVKTDSAGNFQWSKTYGGFSNDETYSLVQTSDGGYALAGYTQSYGAFGNDYWLVKTDAVGNLQWTRTYGGTSDDVAYSMVQTSDGGYALAGSSKSYALGGYDFWLIKTDSAGNMQWGKTYGGTGDEIPYSMIQTSDRGYTIAGYTTSYGAGAADFWLVKMGSEAGLARTDLTDSKISLYRGTDDPYWDYVRVRIWTIKEPSWIYGDINMDGVVDAQDLYILSQNYGKTLSLLSLSGIIAIASIQQYKKRKKQPN